MPSVVEKKLGGRTALLRERRVFFFCIRFIMANLLRCLKASISAKNALDQTENCGSLSKVL